VRGDGILIIVRINVSVDAVYCYRRRGVVCPWYLRYASDRQTDRQTDTRIAILRYIIDAAQ